MKTEKDLVNRCKILMLTLDKLIKENNLIKIRAIGFEVYHQHPSLMKSFLIMTKHYLLTQKKDVKLYGAVEQRLKEILTGKTDEKRVKRNLNR